MCILYSVENVFKLFIRDVLVPHCQINKLVQFLILFCEIEKSLQGTYNNIKNISVSRLLTCSYCLHNMYITCYICAYAHIVKYIKKIRPISHIHL